MKIGIQGYGKMGQMVEEVLAENGHQSVIIKRGAAYPSIDAIIEFTRPDAVWENMMEALSEGIPFVTGTTGWNERLEQLEERVELKNGCVFYASNFSIGVNIFQEANVRLAQLMNGQKDYGVRMQETHHLAKLDSPSGTAITLAEGMIEQFDQKKHWVNEPTTDLSALTIESIRLGEVPGTHEVIYESGLDRIDFKHTAKGRKGFAIGAVRAAEWVAGKKGLFTMKDMLAL